MKKTSRGNAFFLVAVLSTILAIGIHFYLYKHHVDIKLGISGESGVCNINESFNCDTAASSKYAEFFGIPMALLGAFANGVLLLLLGLVHYNLSEDRERTARYAFYFSGFIFLTSLVMGTISWLVLQTGCPFCIGTYLLSALSLLGIWLAFRPSLGFFADDLRDLFGPQRWILGTLVATVALAFLINNMILDSYGYQKIRQMVDSGLEEWNASPTVALDLKDGLFYQKGTDPAKIVVVEFADFLCSHCRHAYPVLHSFARAHSDVKLVYKAFPLDGVCNAAIPGKRDGKSCELAYAALCAEKVGQKGWAAHNFIFDNQEKFFSTPMDQITESLCKATDLDCPQLKTCMNSEEIHETVKRMAQEGVRAQVHGTPSIFFNNKLLPGGQHLPVLESLYKKSGL